MQASTPSSSGRPSSTSSISACRPKLWSALRGQHRRPDGCARLLARLGIERARTATERLTSMLALRESEAKFRTIADAMPQMVSPTLLDGYRACK